MKQLRFLFDNEQFTIQFHHYSEPPNLRWTSCLIVRDKDNTVLVSDTADCHPNDNFSKEFGRKLALTRALRELPKDFRRVVWATYFNRNKNLTTVTGAKTD